MAGELRLNRLGNQLWAALYQDGRLSELHPEFPGERRFAAGAIVLAKVQRVVPQLGAAFVMLDRGREGFLEAADLPGAGDAAERLERLEAGRSMVVQVRRQGRGDKRPRVTGIPEFTSTHLSFRPLRAGCTVSRRIRDRSERERLRRWGVGCSEGELVIRTAAQNVSESLLDRERERLIAAARDVARRAGELQPPRMLCEAPSVLQRLLQNLASRGLERIFVETDSDEREVDACVREIEAYATLVVERFKERRAMFHACGLDRSIAQMLEPRLRLESGASVSIESTEALWAIDVNAAAVRTSSTRKQAALQVNLQAATELGRQIRLRDLSGTIVIDFLALHSREERQSVLDRLRDALRLDRRHHRIAGWTPLGLCEVARRREGPGLLELLGTVGNSTAWGRATRILSQAIERGGRHRVHVDVETAEALERSIESAANVPPIEIVTVAEASGGYRLERC